MTTTRFVLISLPLLSVSFQGVTTAAVRCGDADLSKLPKIVYVSPLGNDSGGCGQTTTSPCKTIQQGIGNCNGEGCGVLVRYGLYTLAAPVQLADGVSLYGSCIFDETAYKYRTTIVGLPAVRANDIKKPTTIYGFVILGSSGTKPGEASLALVASNSTGLKLSHDVVASGRGGNGGTGSTTNGGSGGMGGFSSGNTGGAGGKACRANTPLGSPGDGGKGADFQQLSTSGCFYLCKCSNNNHPASIGQNGRDSGTVSGGKGAERGSAGCQCDPNSGNSGGGGTGDNGLPGACSVTGGVRTGDNRGTFNGTSWIPSRGGDGAVGKVGSGGGGGGSGGYGVFYRLFSDAIDYPGSPGGGGGGGGCGGPGGQGGQQGGASIPLVLSNSSVGLLEGSNVIVPGPGGTGGRGGTGGKGGAGGTGFSGGRFQQWKITAALCSGTVPGFGGKGGAGGQGGAGGAGAGGNGGPSFGIALVKSPPLSIGGVVVYGAQPGARGEAGAGGQNDSSQCKGANGQEGLEGFSDDRNPVVPFITQEQAESNP